jgi:acetyl esterase/lipase
MQARSANTAIPIQKEHRVNSCLALALWPQAPPDGLLQHDRPEELADTTGADQRLNRIYSRVSKPTLTLFPAPAKRTTGTAVVVFPGGAYRELWIDKEGYDIARWLNLLGVTAIVSKYRTGPASLAFASAGDLWSQVTAASLADARRTMRLVRYHSAEWEIDPGRVGTIGFSAGGHLILRLAALADPGRPDAEDPVERCSSRPDFSIPAYPAVPDELSNLPADTGPVFIVNASDDPLTQPQGAVRLYQALHERRIPAELHIFREGGHGFGLGIQGGSVRNWMHLCEEWMRDLGYLAGHPA